MAGSLVRKLVSFALCPSLGTLDTGGNPIPVSRAWRIGDLVKSFVPIMLTDARLSRLLLPWTVQLEPSIAPIANGSIPMPFAIISRIPIAARDRTVIGRRAALARSAFVRRLNSLVSRFRKAFPTLFP